LVLLLTLVALVAGWARPLPKDSASLSVRCSYLRRPSRRDAGTIHIFLQNTSARPVRLDGVLVTGQEGGPRAIPVLWSRITPDPIPPGEVSDVAIKLVTRSTGPLSVTITAQEQKVKTQVDPEPQRLAFPYVAFSDGFGTLYIYLEAIS
jgi:hypothetical protein